MQRPRSVRVLQGLCVVVLVQGLSSCAFFQVLTEQQYYVALSAGQTNVDSESGQDESGGGLLLGGGAAQATVDETDTGLGVGVGCNINKWVGVEVGYQDLGTETYVDIDAGSNVFDGEVNTDGYFVAAVGRYPLSEISNAEWLGRIDAIARLGLFMWESEDEGVTVNLGNQPYSESDSGTDLTYGLGLQGRIWSGLSARIEYDQIADIKFSNFWFGLMWSF